MNVRSVMCAAIAQDAAPNRQQTRSRFTVLNIDRRKRGSSHVKAMERQFWNAN